MGSLEKRVKALEALVGGPPGCEECGHGGGGPVRFIFGGALKEGERFVQEYCGTCGAPTNFTMQLFHPRGVDPLRDELLEGEDA